MSEQVATVENDCSVSMLGANLLVVVSAGPIAAALALAYAAKWGMRSLVYGVLAHELIHGVAWAVFARRPLSSIQIGVRWRNVTPYAHPKDAMPVGAYRVGAVMPAVVMGVLPAVGAIVLGWPRLMAWSLVFVLAAGGDLVVLWLIRRVPAGRMVRDHPTRAGCQVLAG